MKITIRGRGVEVSDRLRAHIERRLALTLGRFGERISRVMVRFTKPNGDESQLCAIDVRLKPETLKAEDADEDLYAAVDHATSRLSRSVARKIT